MKFVQYLFDICTYLCIWMVIWCKELSCFCVEFLFYLVLSLGSFINCSWFSRQAVFLSLFSLIRKLFRYKCICAYFPEIPKYCTCLLLLLVLLVFHTRAAKFHRFCQQRVNRQKRSIFLFAKIIARQQTQNKQRVKLVSCKPQAQSHSLFKFHINVYVCAYFFYHSDNVKLTYLHGECRASILNGTSHSLIQFLKT